MSEVLLPKYMKGDMVKTLDTGEGWKTVVRVIPYKFDAEVTVFKYELTGGIVIGEESITEMYQQDE